MKSSFPWLAATFLAMSLSTALSADEPVRFSRDILPLLSDNCFQCHGPDEANREAGLRLDLRDSAVGESDSGQHAILAGDSQHSELYQRLIADDPDIQMPPKDSGKQLDDQQIALNKQWIDQGAVWGKHWSFESPQKPSLPNAVKQWRSENAIDHFIQVRLAAAGLEPEAPADKPTLIRRVTLDLTGLPPTIAEIDNFLADESPDAFETVVDRLLESSAYGEHMARNWLDAARFADTHGLHLDNERSIWPYRDWVIEAFNRNMPFDQFTIEQLAGDLLPEPTLSQRVATGFNRCNVTTSEGGSIDEEYYVRYAIDRVETTSTVWLGLTAGCAACHDHKFDPLTQKEFYQLFSYFYSLTEKAMDGNALLPPPAVKVPTADQRAIQADLQSQLAAIDRQLSDLQDSIEYQDPTPEASLGELGEADVVWFDDQLPSGAKPQGDGPDPWKFVDAQSHSVYSGSNCSTRTGDGLTQHFFTDASPTLTIGSATALFAYVYLDPEDPPESIQLQFNDGSWNHRAYWGADKCHAAGQTGPANFHAGELPATGKWVRLQVDAGSVGLTAASALNGWAFTQFGGTVYWDQAGIVSVAPPTDQQLASLHVWQQYRQRVKTPSLPPEIQTILDIEKSKREPNQQQQLSEYFIRQVHPSHSKPFAAPLAQQTNLKQQLTELDQAIPATLVMEDRAEQRQAHVLQRGEYTLKGEPVSSQVPVWVAEQDELAPANRLGLAQWLVSPNHPLTARVTVNRIWQHYFGTGLVKTSEDFGVQGQQPSHPLLLDWLAVDFVESGWNVKRLHKLMVMSATYQQASSMSAGKRTKDPENRLLARGPRFRLDAETIRDSALALSGLLVNKVGGKSVRPYQPEGLWKPVGFGGSNTAVFTQDSGAALYRRSMYTFWKRTSPPPSMATFDAPDRETCQVRRARTNTPLQALVLMNDVQFIEAARKFAERVLLEGGSDAEQRLTFAYRATLSRPPKPAELASLSKMVSEFEQEFRSDDQAAQQLLSAGESPRNASLDASELAAWTMLTHLLFNLSETITKG